MSYLDKTRQTYSQIATAYAQAQQDRAPILRDLKKFIALLPANGVALDVGCGPGFDTAVLQAHGLTAIGLDYTYEMMQTGHSEHHLEIPFTQADMRRLPFAGQLDGIWACASLLHLKRTDLLPTLHEFYRVLRPGGILYLSVKSGSGEQWSTIAYGHALPRLFTYWQPETLDPLLETAAFRILNGWQKTSSPVAWLVRFASKEPIE